MAYLLFLLHNGKVLDERDIVFWCNSSSQNTAANWIGGFAVEEEFFVDFQKLSSEVDSIVITAWSQEGYDGAGTLGITDTKFRVSLIECETNFQVAHYDIDIKGPCRCGDVMKLVKAEYGWQFASPDIQMGKSIEEVIAKRQISPA